MKLLKQGFILLIALTINTTIASAQTLDLGVRGGVNIATLADAKQDVDSPRIGLLAGLYANVAIPGSRISIQPEVLYSQKGAEVNNVEVNWSYLEVPLLVRLDLASSTSFNPHIYAGPYLAFTLDSNEDSLKDNDYGLTLGIGADVQKLNFGLRYSLGLEEVFENEEERNQVFAIIAGFNF